MKWSFFALCLFWCSAQAQTIFKCKGPDGVPIYASSPCAADPKKVEVYSAVSESIVSSQAVSAEVARLRSGWGKLCATGSLECVLEQERTFKEMTKLSGGLYPGSPSALKANDCLDRWYSETAGVVDATMWRYCYYR